MNKENNISKLSKSELIEHLFELTDPESRLETDENWQEFLEIYLRLEKENILSKEDCCKIFAGIHFYYDLLLDFIEKSPNIKVNI